MSFVQEYSGGLRGVLKRPPHGPQFSQFHAVFHKIWQNHMLASPLEGWRPFLRGILDPPPEYIHIYFAEGGRLPRKFTIVCLLAERPRRLFILQDAQ